VQAAQQVLEVMPALAVITLATPVLVHLWAAVPRVSLEDSPDLALVMREVCLLVLEVADMAAWVLELEAALRLRLEPALEEELCHLLELVLELEVRQHHRSEPASEEQPRRRSALGLVAMPHLQAQHRWAVALVVSHTAAWVQDLEEPAVFSEALAEAAMEVSV
jgi:hypothetical protein